MWSSGACPPAQSSPAGGWKQAGQMGSLYALGDPRGVGDHRLSKRLFTPPTALSRPSSPHLHVALLPRPKPLHESIIPQHIMHPSTLPLSLAPSSPPSPAHSSAPSRLPPHLHVALLPRPQPLHESIIPQDVCGLGLELAQARAQVQAQQVAGRGGGRGKVLGLLLSQVQGGVRGPQSLEQDVQVAVLLRRRKLTHGKAGCVARACSRCTGTEEAAYPPTGIHTSDLLPPCREPSSAALLPNVSTRPPDALQLQAEDNALELLLVVPV